MMPHGGYNSWRDPWQDGSYQRLVNLARSRLGGITHLAEDAVQEALISWYRSDAANNPRARIETIVISRSHDLRRQLGRSHKREANAMIDGPSATPDADQALETSALRLAAHQSYRAAWGEVEGQDGEVLELLLAGFNQVEVGRQLDLTRSMVRSSVRRWRLALDQVESTLR